MALKKCPECGEEVSTLAASCPNCGAPIKQKPREHGCIASLLMLIGGAVVLLVIVTWLFSADTQGTKTQDIEACTNRGIAYFKAIGSYPELKSAPNAGRSAAVVARERCNRTTGAFDAFTGDSEDQAKPKQKLSNEEYARITKLANEAFARKQKLAAEIEAQRLAAGFPTNWTDKEARTRCRQDLRRAYVWSPMVGDLLGKEPHENNTILVGLVTSDRRTEYEGQQVIVGCIYKQDGSLSSIFFNSQIAGWIEPPKR